MQADEFLKARETRDLLKRTARISGTAIALHPYNGKAEEDATAKCGACAEACAHVAGLPWGKQACRRSREKAAAASFRRNKPVPFLCHMGFSCVSMSVTFDGATRHAITLGPFCPSEAAGPGALESDALHGLHKLERDPVETLPFALDDIPLVAAAGAPDMAAWLAESLAHRFDNLQETEAADVADTTTARGRASVVHKASTPIRDPFQAGDILAALTAGDQTQARTLVRRLIKDSPARKRHIKTARRARTLAIVAAVLETAENTGRGSKRLWQKFNALPAAVATCDEPQALTRAAMDVLGQLKRAPKAPAAEIHTLRAVTRILDTRLASKISLQGIAREVGLPPSTLTRQLQRAYGMTFTEYLGRRRVDRAKELLQTTQLSVVEISRRVGLNDASNLGKLFRKFEGMAPSEYRKRFRPKAKPKRTGTKS